MRDQGRTRTGVAQAGEEQTSPDRGGNSSAVVEKGLGLCKVAFLAGFRSWVGTREMINMPGGHFNKEEAQATHKHGAKCQACPVIKEHTWKGLGAILYGRGDWRSV